MLSAGAETNSLPTPSSTEQDQDIKNNGDFMVRFRRALSIHLEGESHVFVILGASVSFVSSLQ